MKDNALSSLNVLNEGKAGLVFGVFHRYSGEAFSPDYATWQPSPPPQSYSSALQRILVSRYTIGRSNLMFSVIYTKSACSRGAQYAL